MLGFLQNLLAFEIRSNSGMSASEGFPILTPKHLGVLIKHFQGVSGIVL